MLEEVAFDFVLNKARNELDQRGSDPVPQLDARNSDLGFIKHWASYILGMRLKHR